MEESQRSPGRHPDEEPHEPAPGDDGAPDGEEGPHEHHAFESDVDDARALREDPAHSREREWCREAEHRGQDARGQDRVEGIGVLGLKPDRADDSEEAETDRESAELSLTSWEHCDAACEPEEADCNRGAGVTKRPWRKREPESEDPQRDADDPDRSWLGRLSDPDADRLDSGFRRAHRSASASA